MSDIPKKDIIISMTRCHFIDLLDKLEHYDFDFVDLSAFKNYVFMAPLNEYKYMIHSISNNNEKYTLQYCKKYKIKEKQEKQEKQETQETQEKQENIKETSIDVLEPDIILADIPYGTFGPANLYDLEINLTKKTFNLVNEYVVIDMYDIIEKYNNSENQNKKMVKRKNKLLHLLGC
jgi:hypothetical protein